MSYRFAPVLLAAVLGIAPTACRPNAPSAPPAAEAAPAPAPIGHGPACPEPDFGDFLARFGREIAFQQRAVADPLASSVYVVDADPAMRHLESRIPLSEVEWPVMPDPASLQAQGREMLISDEIDGGTTVLIRTPEAREQRFFHFARRPCWQLVRIEQHTA
ncbi:hypothetical protein [Luteimonas huabeiensis]|uniref:hypothetical protein n=1 Tax=Luteimonas huabeiensis TaxID=1244513 RepID=UPI000466E076|nr:hypothetical protein [Luteimonas huabeiensis]